jgi:septum formation protein
MTARLVLASGSPFRRAQLLALGLPCVAVPHRVEERTVMEAGLAPDEVVRRLAVAKAASVAGDHPGAYVVGSDQVVDVDGAVVGKPVGAAEAEAQLRRLAGREHRLVTAVALRHPDATSEVAVDVHRMRMRPLSAAEIARYVARDDPRDCAGSYKAEGLGVTLFEAMAGADFHAITGLPMIELCAMLRRAGFELP